MKTLSMPAAHSFEHARQLVLDYGWNAMSYQILNPGIEHWFAPDGKAVVGYATSSGYRVVAGAPVCAQERLADVAAAFNAEAARAGKRVCYFGAQERFVQRLAQRGRVTSILLGAQPVWQPADWPGIIAGKSSLRQQVVRARNKGVIITPWDAQQATKHAVLTQRLHEWLATRGLPPMHFVVEPDTLGVLADRRVLVANRNQQIVGFLIASPVPLRNGWLVEQMVRSPAAPNGTIELLLDTAMRTFAAEGAAYVTLGLSPLSRHAQITPPPQPLLVRALLFLLRVHGQRFYNFEGLDRFKAKFQPAFWEPVYAVTTGRHISLHTLYAIAGVFGGTSPIWFISRALARALRQEGRWLRGRIRQQLWH